MPRPQPLDQWTDQVADAFPNLSRPQATVLALYSFGMILAQRCGLNSVVTALVPLLGVGFHTLRSRLQEFYQPAAAKSGRRRDRARRHHLFRPAAGLDPPGLAVHPLGLGAGCHQLGRPLHRLVDQRRLPRPGHPRGLEGPAGQRAAPLEAGVDRLASALRRLGPARLDGDRDDRPRVVCPLALPRDPGLGLAPRDADHHS